VPYRAEDARYETRETIFLPLSDNDDRVNLILVFANCSDLLNPQGRVRLDL